MNLAEPQEVLPFTIFGSARYRSSNSEHHRREPVTAELWNTADWGRMGRRFPHWGLGAWECQPLTDQRTKKNRFEFFADMWSLAATSWIRPKSTARTKTRNCSGVSCARSRARVSSSQLSLASASIRTASEAWTARQGMSSVLATRAFAGWASKRSICIISIALRSEEHTSELQSQSNLVCRLLLEKKKKEQATVIRTLLGLTRQLHMQT